MDDELPDGLLVQRDTLAAEIYDAFGSVTRKGAVSWSEARVIDRRGTDAERRRARQADREANWQGLVDAPDWPGNYGSEWSFLDGPGFRYYLAPALVRLVRIGEDCDVQFHLIIRDENGDWGRRFLPILDDRQRHCIRRVIEYAIAVEESTYGFAVARTWREAYQSYWVGLPPLVK